MISGNTFSAVYVESGINQVANNVIGLDAAVTRGLSNGGCGVWIGNRAGGTDVDNNHIGFNQYAGVCIDREAWAVALNGNSFQANYHRAIDWGLDGVVSGPLPIPVITSVHVDHGKTIVEGETGAVGGTFQPVVQIYANDAPDPSGYGEGQYYLGGIRAEDGRFRFEIEADLGGKWIAATNTRHDYTGFAKPPRPVTNIDTGWGYFTTSSEFSRAVEVPR